MKLVSLNTWGGRAGIQNLKIFIDRYKFCEFLFLQEMHDFPNELSAEDHYRKVNTSGEGVWNCSIKDMKDLYQEKLHFFDSQALDHYGVSMHVEKSLPIREVGDIFVYKERQDKYNANSGNHARNMQFCVIHRNERKLVLCNLHGLWNGMGKTDTEERIKQSQKIVSFLDKYKKDNYEIILAGDFNLLPDTESVRILENFGLRNLIKEYNITSTRTSFYTKPEKFADYIFVSSGIQVNEFKVLPDEVSDHSPLYVEFGL